MAEPMNPIEAAKSLVQGLSIADGFYTAIAVLGVFAFYAIASRRRTLERSTFLAVMFWLIALVGWLFEMYMVTFAKIQSGGILAWALLIIGAGLLMVAIQFLTKKSRLYERIMSGAAIALIGFGILASFGRGYQPIGFALVMGLVLGLILGMLISVRRGMHQSLRESAEPPKEGRRRVTEI